MNKRLVPVLLLLVALPLSADFRDVERGLRAQLGRPMYIPFLGVARFVTWIAHPKGVHDFQLVTWEKTEGQAVMDGAELERMLRRGLSAEYQPVVRVRSHGEWTFIYARPFGDRIEIMLLTHDHSDTVLIRADVDAEKLAQTVNEHRFVAER